jgi:poly(A) polymerase Pap1
VVSSIFSPPDLSFTGTHVIFLCLVFWTSIYPNRLSVHKEELRSVSFLSIEGSFIILFLYFLFFCHVRLGLVESRLRLLIIKLEHLNGIKRAHPFVKSIDRVETRKSAEDDSEKKIYASIFYLGLLLELPQSTSSSAGPKLDLSQAVSDFVESIITWDKKTPGMDVFVKHLKR